MALRYITSYLVDYIFLLFLLLYSTVITKCKYRISVIETKENSHNFTYSNNNIDKYIVTYNIKYKNYIQKSKSVYYIEHNSIYDDILFLIPLYNIIIKTKIIAICCNIIKNKRYITLPYIVNNYTVTNNCIYFDINFLKYLHINSNIFRLCKFDEVYKIMLKRNITYKPNSICKESQYSYKYSIVTTVYKRYNLEKQIFYFLKQALPPKYIIVVHDRNLVKVPYNKFDIIYVHTVNFPAGFYFRYLISLLSPVNDVVIYDDDWFPYNSSSHKIWINNIKRSKSGIFGHHSGSKNGMKWCATPLMVHRRWLLLIWYNDIYEIRAAEDGHISFTLFLLCNINCRKISISWLNYQHDNYSSSNISIKKTFWNDFTMHEKNKKNSSYIHNIKHKYNIY